ncbi:MAG: DnaJ domain-containing protein [Chlamydiota bacterium]
MLRPLYSTIVLPNSYYSKEGVRAIAEQYLSVSGTYAIITKSINQKYHLVTQHQKSFNGLITALKVISYATVILPLIAILITKSTTNPKLKNYYYANDTDLYDHSIHNRTPTNEEVLPILNQFSLHILNQACKNEDYTAIRNMYHSPRGKEIFNQIDENGDTLFTKLCITTYRYSVISFLCDIDGSYFLKQRNTKNKRTILVDAVYENFTWKNLSDLNAATRNYLFKNISESDLLKIKKKNLDIYNAILKDPSFIKPTSDPANLTFENALKTLFDGKEPIKTKKAIEKAYKLSCLKHHPDKNGGTKEAHDKFVSIQNLFNLIKTHKNWNNLPTEEAHTKIVPMQNTSTLIRQHEDANNLLAILQ